MRDPTPAERAELDRLLEETPDIEKEFLPGDPDLSPELLEDLRKSARAKGMSEAAIRTLR